jgi:uncharacterized protein
MKKIFIFVMIIGSAAKGFAQTYSDSILLHRENYKQEFLKDADSPLGKDDLQYLDFYTIDKNYRVVATFKKVTDKKGFMMQTHSGKQKHYFVYGKLSFILKKKKYTLCIYQSESLMSNEAYKDYLFIPFTDATNSVTTFGGGRYLDFRLADIKHNQLIIDFNTCYNPYCAFAGGYSCPIPPKENDVNIQVEAGEKLYVKPIKE